MSNGNPLRISSKSQKALLFASLVLFSAAHVSVLVYFAVHHRIPESASTALIWMIWPFNFSHLAADGLYILRIVFVIRKQDGRIIQRFFWGVLLLYTIFLTGLWQIVSSDVPPYFILPHHAWISALYISLFLLSSDPTTRPSLISPCDVREESW